MEARERRRVAAQVRSSLLAQRVMLDALADPATLTDAACRERFAPHLAAVRELVAAAEAALAAAVPCGEGARE